MAVLGVGAGVRPTQSYGWSWSLQDLGLKKVGVGAETGKVWGELELGLELKRAEAGIIFWEGSGYGWES